MTCPKCRKKLTPQHLLDSPECDGYIGTLCGIRNASKRKTITHAGGRKPIIRTCSCGFAGSTRDWRAHKCPGTKQ